MDWGRKTRDIEKQLDASALKRKQYQDDHLNEERQKVDTNKIQREFNNLTWRQKKALYNDFNETTQR